VIRQHRRTLHWYDLVLTLYYKKINTAHEVSRWTAHRCYRLRGCGEDQGIDAGRLSMAGCVSTRTRLLPTSDTMRLCAAWQGNLHQSLSSHTCRTTSCIQTLIVLTETSDSSCHVLTSSFVLPRHQEARNVSPAAAPVLTASLDHHSRRSEPVRVALSSSALMCIIFPFWGWACLKTDLQDQRPVRTCLLSWSSTDRIFSCLQTRSLHAALPQVLVLLSRVVFVVFLWKGSQANVKVEDICIR